MSFPKRPLIEITWQDHTSEDRWFGADEHPKGLATIKSIGWVLRENEAEYVIAAAMADDGDFSCVQTIGKGLIISVKPLRGKKKNAKTDLSTVNKGTQ